MIVGQKERPGGLWVPSGLLEEVTLVGEDYSASSPSSSACLAATRSEIFMKGR